MTTREERRQLLLRRTRRSRDAQPAGLGHGAFSVRADRRWLSSKDGGYVSAAASSGSEYGCESRRKRLGAHGFNDDDLSPCACAEQFRETGFDRGWSGELVWAAVCRAQRRRWHGL